MKVDKLGISTLNFFAVWCTTKGNEEERVGEDSTCTAQTAITLGK
jgi:hypothetical protein